MSVTISGLPPAGSLTGDELVPIVQSSYTVRTTTQAIADLGGGSGGSVANPTATIGLTAVNGVAATALRSDGAPPLSQDIEPTWSAAHTFDNTVTCNSTVTLNDTTTYLDSEVGWRDIPQTLLNAIDDYTFALTDRGKHVFQQGESGGSPTYTIPTAADVAFPIGTVITVVSNISPDITIDGEDVTLVLAGSGIVVSVTLSELGMATLLNVAEDVWFINGVGLS